MTPLGPRRSATLALLRNALLIYVVGAGIAALGGALALVQRPESGAAGRAFIIDALGAAIGTAAPGIALTAAVIAPFALRRALAANGVSAGLEQLGVSARDLLRSLLPILATLGLVGGAFVTLVEPPAWRAVHGLRGSPAASAVFLGRISSGETVSVRGLIVAPTASALQLWSPTWTATAERLLPAGPGWSIDGLSVRAPSGTWTAEAVALVPVMGASAPTNPLTRSVGALWGDTADRGRLVLHRRLAIPFLSLVLGLWGWALGGRGRAAAPALTALALTTFAGLRGADAAVAGGSLDGALAAWLPVLLLGGVLLPLGWRR